MRSSLLPHSDSGRMTGLDLSRIWSSWRIKCNSIECEDKDFRIRHNRIFTNVIVHHFDERVSRICDVCQSEPERLLHLLSVLAWLVSLKS